MPTVLSVTMGVRRRACSLKKQAIVSRLVAIENWPAWTCCARQEPVLTRTNDAGDPFSVNGIAADRLFSVPHSRRVRKTRTPSTWRHRRRQGRQGLEELPSGALSAVRSGGISGQPPSGCDGKAVNVARAHECSDVGKPGSKAPLRMRSDRFAARGLIVWRWPGPTRKASGGSRCAASVRSAPEDAKATIATARQMGVQSRCDRRSMGHRPETARTLGLGRIFSIRRPGDVKLKGRPGAESIEKVRLARCSPTQVPHCDVLQRRGLSWA